MMRAFRTLLTLTILVPGLSLVSILDAQEVLQTPSQQTKEAVDKLGQVPSAISRGLETLREAVGSKLHKGVDIKTGPSGKSKTDDLTVPAEKIEQAEPARFSAQGKRDPFRPATMTARAVTRAPRENLSPLERFDLGQLKVVGVIWDIKDPRAIIEDSGGLGYIVKAGTPMGVNDGKVKTIGRNEIVVEEFYEDKYGARKKRDVNMKLAME
jgi:Tfp pilus assembly protein PilP